MRFEDKIKALAIRFNLSVTSWIRSRKHNDEVGGVASSRHLEGLAVDIILDEKARDSGAFLLAVAALNLQWIEEGDHYHLQEPRA